MSLRRLVWFMAGDPPPLGEDDLSKAMERHRGALLRGERAALARMRKAYRTARKRILREAAALFRVMARAQAAGLPLGESWLPRQERYSILLETVRAQMDRFGAAASKIGTGLMATWALSGAANAADLMEIEVAIADAQGAIPRGFTKAITRLPKEAVEAVVGALSEGSPLQDLLGGYGRASAAKAAETLTAGVAQGHNPRKIARALRASLDGDAQRAERIARTEGIRAHRTAAILNYQANSDVVAGWRWSSSRDRRTCPVCLALDGQEFALDEPMGAHPSCVVAGTTVASTSVHAATTRWYSGEIVHLRTEMGHVLSITPNHPVLTVRGWIPAGEIQEGDHLLRSSDGETAVADLDPHKERLPTLIEEVAGALRGSLGMASVSVPPSPVHFHGDGEGGEIDVVGADRLLGHGFNSHCLEHALDLALEGRDEPLRALAAEGGPAKGLVRLLAATCGRVGGGGEPGAILGGATGNHQSVGLGPATGGNTALAKDPVDHDTLKPQAVREGFYGLSGLVPAHHFGDRFGAEAIDPAISDDLDSSLLKHTADHLVGYATGERDPSDWFAAFVARDQVVEVRRDPGFHGLVFNLETSSGWYFANTFIVHNCRCVPVPINRFRPSTRGTGEEWLRAQLDAVARQMLGPSRYRLWKDGTPLPTFVRRGNDPRWGPWARLIPLRELGGGLPPLPVLPAPSPPAPPKLLGGAASASLEFSPKLTRKMRETLQEVADGIDGLHGVGQMASVKVVRVLTVGRRKVAVPGAGKVPVVPSSGKATLGAFRYVPNQGAVDISVSTHGDHPRMTFAHEFAHLLDHVHGLSKSRKLAEGFVRSGARERLVKERAAGRGTAAYLAYLLQPREVWARAYSQWAAVRLGGEIAEELAKDVASSGTVQWLDGEFDEMARAVEEVLKEAGLL